MNRTASTGLWDHVSGQIRGALAANGAVGQELDFGDGSDGAFSDGASVSGVSITGNTITLDTGSSSQRIYQFTSFQLSAGKTLNATGSYPLVLRISGTTSIAGTVDLSGQTGTANGAAGAGNALTGAIAGGTAAAGSGSGGEGGRISGGGFATAGSPATPGGLPGYSNVDQFTPGGGGGGCNGSGATAGANSQVGYSDAGTCALTQTQIANAFESAFAGGAGGGGGGSCYSGASGTPCSAAVGGGGGGAGGGAIRIVSLGAITLTGTISAAGGDGGDNNADAGVGPDCGGGGGGGAGGSVWIQSASSVSGGTITVTGGAGGETDAAHPTCFAGISTGGNGSNGTSRADASPTPSLGLVNNPVQSPSATYVVYSKSLGFEDGYYGFISASHSEGCGATGTVTVSYQGSNDPDFADAVTVSEAQISQLSNYPYLRLKVSIAASGATPPCVTGVTIQHEPGSLSNLALKGGLACGALETARNGSGPGPAAKDIAGDAALFTLAGAFAVLMRRRKPLLAH